MNAELVLGPLVTEDVNELARLHQRAFPGFFLSALGVPFLVQLYHGFLHDSTAVAITAKGPDGKVCGGVVGTTEPQGFYGRLVRDRWLGFTSASAKAVIKHPTFAPRLVRAITYRGDGPNDTVGALLCSICVDPTQQGVGAGGHLLAAWTTRVASLGAKQAFLTTDATDNDAVNQFYSCRGWVLTSTYQTRQGRFMNRYVRPILEPRLGGNPAARSHMAQHQGPAPYRPGLRRTPHTAGPNQLGLGAENS